MNDVKEFFKKLATDPKGKELLKATKEPDTADEAANLYVGIAKELGANVSREDMLIFVQANEKEQRRAAEKAVADVKVALADSELENVAGGAEGDACESTQNGHSRSGFPPAERFPEDMGTGWCRCLS